MSYMFRVLKDSGFTLDLGLGPIIVGCIRLFVAGNENLARAVVSQINQVIIIITNKTNNISILYYF